MGTDNMDKTRQAAIDTASDWFSRSRDEDFSAAEQREFAGWLKESPVHVREYLAIARLWGDVSAIEDIEKLKANAAEELADEPTNVVALASAAPSDAQPVPVAAAAPSASRRRLFRMTGWVAAASLVLGVCMVTFRTWLDTDDLSRHSTVIGEQRSLALEDGSVVEMNTASAIHVNFTDQARYVTLEAGEVFFDIRKDPARPFVVFTGSTRIRVLGTKFNVYMRTTSTTITVLEGDVAVDADGVGVSGRVETTAASGGESSVHLKSGQQAVIDAQYRQIATKVLTDSQKYVAWTDRQLIFERTRLDDILAEFARYNEIDYRITSDVTAALQLTGTFNSHDMQALVEYLEFHPDVTINHQGSVLTIGAAGNGSTSNHLN